MTVNVLSAQGSRQGRSQERSLRESLGPGSKSLVQSSPCKQEWTVPVGATGPGQGQGRGRGQGWGRVWVKPSGR